jgi:hypothetical protein
MDKHELALRLARRSHQSKGSIADKLDALVYALWKDSRQPRQKFPDQTIREGGSETSTAPVKDS